MRTLRQGHTSCNMVQSTRWEHQAVKGYQYQQQLAFVLQMRILEEQAAIWILRANSHLPGSTKKCCLWITKSIQCMQVFATFCKTVQWFRPKPHEATSMLPGPVPFCYPWKQRSEETLHHLCTFLEHCTVNISINCGTYVQEITWDVASWRTLLAQLQSQTVTGTDVTSVFLAWRSELFIVFMFWLV